MDRTEVVEAIRSSFAGVRLGEGISLGQAEAIDNAIFGIETPNFARLPLDEVTDDWTQVPEPELRRDNIPHLDGEGLRYYLPAFLLWLLDHYADDWLLAEGTDMAVIGTIAAISPDPEFASSMATSYKTWFSLDQRHAVASYVEALPHLVALDYEDEMRIRGARDTFWPTLLQSEP